MRVVYHRLLNLLSLNLIYAKFQYNNVVMEVFAMHWSCIFRPLREKIGFFLHYKWTYQHAHARGFINVFALWKEQ